MALRFFFFFQSNLETSLSVQWLRLCISNAGDMGLIPGQGTKISRVTQCGQGEKKIFLIKKKKRALWLWRLSDNTEGQS